MQTSLPSAATLAKREKKPCTAAAVFPPLESLNRPTVRTEEAAFYLNRRPQTLRGWACFEDGPIRCLRVHGRLAWKVADIKRVLGVA
ncbi:hypothetical protein LJR175_000987 [Variovorax sp. LjRoot175]|uniref:hypothetical protein n=1 Tax=Variovorax sp. LjRoot175 TaxID=3342276 RepID=UPI003ED10DDC